jgi:hypothetical protein
MGTLFERLNGGRTAPIEATPVESAPSTEEAPVMSLLEQLEKERPLPPPIDERDTPLERLERFLRRWRRPVISLRDLYTHGPKRDRNKQRALSLAQILVQQGVLVPIVPRRRDVVKWKVVPKGQRPTAQPPAAA